ncbi:plasmid stabilization protein [Candidatus Peregrinibacteria bacterium CG_4_10_14_0_2_um_filter_38_24]|nr:MAG: plasmid stabilization protein [Candidatus Peregrinibacteria bacterium CG_4_10_14_0_2_um_filter_38_24]PJC39022.1 MAG: plasmid stabilization protein [Candidatus Peregrinibacteria bacterium CG_4_9_14_0_2_um_filter_38_9]
MYKLVITESYQKRAKKFFEKHPKILEQYEKILKILCINPQHPSLRMHKLSGRLAELFSVSVTISYRLIIYFIIKDDQIVPVDIGSHDEVY